MKKHHLPFLIALVTMALLMPIKSFRNAIFFDTKIAFAANEPRYGWMIIGGEEIQIQFETALTSRNLTVKDFCNIYGFNLETNGFIFEQWCQQRDDGLCELRFVGTFLNENGHLTRLPVVPEHMYY